MVERKSVFVHEDDAGQIELLPCSAWQACEAELRGQSDDIDPEAPDDLLGLGIQAQLLHEALRREFTACDKVFTGYGNHREPYRGATAYSHDGSPVLFVLRDSRDVVVTIWLAYTHHEASRDALARVVLALGQTHQLMLIDRVLGRLADLRDAASIDEYLKSRSQQERQLDERMREYRQAAGQTVWQKLRKLFATKR